ncbi:YHS domain-containing (seleno)protein [Ovoidimarina sediminis]|uniref:YHS domain-containing (seleno)protein n=1 Tax=Ovoidimarina sediminis TaxID=3079856 RepID=UPI002909ED17|nr:YHS domain-containing (seleno)protein [Rhodophyticola sp. MJ-SS7]MDU8946755.1 YHS domain-containing (seleno)protein [Rhodophyticola sp. MJ-SS7]
MTTRRQFLSASAAFVPALLLARHAAANAIASVYSKNGIAIDGTDPVAYFTESRAVAGDPGITHEWSGVTWRFSSPRNREAFSADPEGFAPQFGGYCAWAVSRGYTAPTAPDAWTIFDGQLFLNYSKRIRRRWERDIPDNVARGRANWPSVLDS